MPSFITKLWKLVNERKYEHLITWSPDGRSFTIKDQSRFSKEVLPLYFKHSNMGSFVRQLNMYGFRKMANIENCGLRPESDEVSFHHPNFVKGQERSLQIIRRKKNQSGGASSDVKLVNSQQMVSGDTSQAVSMPSTSSDMQNQLVAIMQRQDSLEKFRMLTQQENAAIWKEIAFLRRQNNEQQNVIQNLIKFLISLVPQVRNMSGKRKSSLISSMANSMPDSKRLNTGSQSSSSTGDSFSMDTIRNGIIDAIRNGLSNTSESAAASNGVMIQDVTNEDQGQDMPAIENKSLIAHSSNSDSSPLLTESDMDLLSQICKQLNLVPPSAKKGSSGRDNDTVAANNIVEVPEDFILSPEEEEVVVEDLADLADNVAGLFSTSEVLPETDNETCDPLLETKDQLQPMDGLLQSPLTQSPTEQHLEQPLNDPLDLQSLDLVSDGQDEFILPDLSTSLVDDDIVNFDLLV